MTAALAAEGIFVPAAVKEIFDATTNTRYFA
jgi:hypothetical protein